MFIGKIVSSSSHVEYTCQVHGPGETDQVPQPQDYGFSTFVAIQQPEGGLLIGVIYNTNLMNPEFGNLGPRLSPREELAIFSPDYLAEKVTLVSVYVLGMMEATGTMRQGIPVVAATLDARVRVLTREETVAFHRIDGRLRLAYMPMLIAMGNPLAPHLMLHILNYLSQLFPQETQRLAVLASNLAWKSRVQPAG